MKKILIVVMMCFVVNCMFTCEVFASFWNCTAHYSVVDEQGRTVWAQDVEGTNCKNAVKTAKYFYFLATGDSSVL